MLSAAFNAFKTLLLGATTHVKRPPKRPLEEESGEEEDDYEEGSHFECRAKRQCTDMDQQTHTPLSSNPSVRGFPWVPMKGRKGPLHTSTDTTATTTTTTTTKMGTRRERRSKKRVPEVLVLDSSEEDQDFEVEEEEEEVEVVMEKWKKQEQRQHHIGEGGGQQEWLGNPVSLVSSEQDVMNPLGVRREGRKHRGLATPRPPMSHSIPTNTTNNNVATTINNNQHYHQQQQQHHHHHYHNSSSLLADFRFVPSASNDQVEPDTARKGKDLNLYKNVGIPKVPASSGSSDLGCFIYRLWGKRKSPGLFPSRGKYSMAHKSFCEEEKLRYRQLLQQYTERHLSPSASSTTASHVSSVVSSPSPLGMVTRSRLPIEWTKQKKEEMEKVSNEWAAATITTPMFPSSPHLDSRSTVGVGGATITKEDRVGRSAGYGSLNIPLVDLCQSQEESGDDYTNAQDSDDDSVVVVKEVLTPAPQPNSLEDRLKELAVYDLSWVKSMKKEYEQRKEAAVKKVDMNQKIIQGLEERRSRRALLDTKLSQRMQLLDLTFPQAFTELPEEEEEEELVKLTPEMESEIDNALRRGRSSEVLIEKFHIQITRRDIATLDGLNWLNDEVINFYMNLLMERCQKNNNYPNVYAFNTFFFPKLSKSGYSSVRRWTRKVDIFGHDMLLVPVHLGMHWCLSHIDFKMKTITYFDSMGSSNDSCLEALEEYLREEHRDKKGSQYSTTDWKLVNNKKIPQQMNGSDCGMFTCVFAEYLSRRARITFCQEDMPYFRRRLVYEIINGTLL